MSDKPATLAPAIALAGLLFACGGGGAQAQDPLKSAACSNALEQLQAARGSGAAPALVESLRASAASTCLGGAGPPQRPGRVAQPPVAIPPPQLEVPQRVAPLPAPALPPPPVAIDSPPAPLLCDPGGCWSDTGTHLRQIGPNLSGPNGMCTQQGGLVYCP